MKRSADRTLLWAIVTFQISGAPVLCGCTNTAIRKFAGTVTLGCSTILWTLLSL
jgi:hypothetical protein